MDLANGAKKPEVPLELRGDAAILRALVESQQCAVASVASALGAIAAAADALSDRLHRGGRLVYAGAGSSGLIAIQDGAELPGTFGLPREKLVFLMAGGMASILDLVSSAEDDAEGAEREIAELGDLAGDAVVAISASGSTPYTLAAARAAKGRGACVVGIANRRGAPLLAIADLPILLDSGDEVVIGSTRLAAGTAQKSALGLLSTLVNIRLGNVYDGLMVGMRPDNIKLQARALDILTAIGGHAKPRAAELLAAADGSVKAALLIGAGARDAGEAQRLLMLAGGDLRGAFERLGKKPNEIGA